MKAKALLMLMLLAICCVRTVQAARSLKPVKVFVDCDTGDDAVGARLCFALKERIRASHGFELVYSERPALFKVRILSMDAAITGEEKGLASFAAVVFTSPHADDTEVLVATSILHVGSKGVSDEVEGILATLDQVSEPLRKPRE